MAAPKRYINSAIQIYASGNQPVSMPPVTLFPGHPVIFFQCPKSCIQHHP